jgi:hypothetical protein
MSEVLNQRQIRIIEPYRVKVSPEVAPNKELLREEALRVLMGATNVFDPKDTSRGFSIKSPLELQLPPAWLG